MWETNTQRRQSSAPVSNLINSSYSIETAVCGLCLTAGVQGCREQVAPGV